MARVTAKAWSVAVSAAVVLTFLAVPAVAQMAPSAPRTTISSMEGTVSKVDPGTGKVQVSSGLFGLCGKTLEVGPDTAIQMEGRQSNLAELREGDKVKASYEVREGHNIARSIDVLLPKARSAPAKP